MAITAANVLSLTDDVGGASTTTSSVAFANNKLYLVASGFRGGALPEVSGITGGGITWTEAAHFITGGPPAICVFKGLATSGAITGALTISYLNGPTAIKISVDEFDGVDTTTPVVQAVGNGGGAALSGSVTLAAFGDAVNNAAYGAFQHNALEATNVEAGYTELADNFEASVPNVSMGTEWKVGQDLAVTESWATSIAWTAVAAEIKMGSAAPAGYTPGPGIPWVKVP